MTVLEKGADVNVETSMHETALDWAVKFGDPIVMKLLRQTGAEQLQAPVRQSRLPDGELRTAPAENESLRADVIGRGSAARWLARRRNRRERRCPQALDDTHGLEQAENGGIQFADWNCAPARTTSSSARTARWAHAFLCIRRLTTGALSRRHSSTRRNCRR